jgi:hypothetical protein
VILSTLLLHSQEIRPIAWCVIGLCAGLYLFFNGFRLLQRRHLVLNTPVSKIRSASLGMVELSGLAVGPYTMAAPITERPCYYYRTVVWEWKRRGRSSQWVKVAAECMHMPFFLDDNTAKIMVDPRGAELDLHRDFQQEFCDSFFTTKEEAPPNVHAFLSRHGIMTSNKIKVEEFCIKPKNALFLLGTLDENPGLELTAQPIQDDDHTTLTSGDALWFNPVRSGLGQATLSFVTGGGASANDTSPEESTVGERFIGSRTFPESTSSTSGQVIHLSPDRGPTNTADMTQQQKIAAALMKAGISSPAAWAAARVKPSAVAANAAPNGSPNGGNQVAPQPATSSDAFDPHPPVVLMKGKNNPTFLISWRSQRELARSLGWKCTLMIWGGPALSLLCLYVLLNLMHWL